VEHEHVIGTGWRCQGVILRTKQAGVTKENPEVGRVADPYHFNPDQDPEPVFYFNAGLDLDADADPDPAHL